ncbi:hypothetical protein DW058_17295 [Clostridiaceae bacterium AF42-6]|nr:hypothetical protein DW058_17295 [Clostridiaceae bacterium AF42-6]
MIIRFEEMLEARRLQLHISENANNRFIELIDLEARRLQLHISENANNRFIELIDKIAIRKYWLCAIVLLYFSQIKF